MARRRDHRAERQRANERARAAGFTSKDARLRALRKQQNRTYTRDGYEYPSYDAWRWREVVKPKRSTAQAQAWQFGDVYEAWLGNRPDSIANAVKFIRVWGRGSTYQRIGPDARPTSIDEAQLADGWFSIREWGERYDELYAEHAAA